VREASAPTAAAGFFRSVLRGARAANKLGALLREPVPGLSHLEELRPLLALHAGGELAALLGVFAVLGRFLHGSDVASLAADRKAAAATMA